MSRDIVFAKTLIYCGFLKIDLPQSLVPFKQAITLPAKLIAACKWEFMRDSQLFALNQTGL